MPNKSGSASAAKVRALEVGRKTRPLQVFMLVLAALSPMIAMSNFLTGDPVSGSIGLFIAAVFLGCFFLLKKGRYVPASMIASVFVWCALASAGFIGSAGQIFAIYRFALYLVVAMAFASFFVLDTAIPFAMAAANVAMGVFFVLDHRSSFGSAGVLVNNLMVSLLFAVLANILIIAPSRMGRVMSLELESERERGLARADTLKAAAERSQSNLAALAALSERAAGIRGASMAAIEAVRRIEARLVELDAAADSAVSEAGAIGARVRDLSGHIDSESAAQAQSAAAVNEMVTSIGAVDASAKKRREALRGLLGTTDEGAARLGALLGAIGRIEGSMGTIREMIGVINNVANSINLLAMNASIEAAHAGEAGKGFAVVASEIRTCAEGTSKSAKEIGLQLKEVMGNITAAADEGAYTRSSFDSMRRETDAAISSFNEISQATGELSESGRQILESIRALNESTAGLREGGSAIASAQEQLLLLQARTKEYVKAVADEALAIINGIDRLESEAAGVVAVADESSRRAKELQLVVEGEEAPKPSEG